MKLDTIKNYISEDKKQQFFKIIDEIYLITEHLSDTYPGYKKWFYEKQVKGCCKDNRNILFIKNENDEIIGLSSLKKEKHEKKICTLYVKDGYRQMKIGKILLEESFKYLETTMPLVTFSEDNLLLYEKIINNYNWKLIEVIDDKYKVGKKEFCFNGYLNKEIK